ncbi:hypothetical protein CEXT_390321 [Caerostris extrusa]|uniref:Uncharacterized protein n=1 Tax=Caerostris extrusa TaxID=172846 RepID=A0AAV4S2Z9_CAEEX|nr:hypothetical protein CEXT_390321 [Caerostris extrusa]
MIIGLQWLVSLKMKKCIHSSQCRTRHTAAGDDPVAERFHLHHLVHPLWKAIRRKKRKGEKGGQRGKNGWFKDFIGENETFTCIGTRQFVKEPLNEQEAIFRSEMENYFSFDIIRNFSLECKLSIPAERENN